MNKVKLKLKTGKEVFLDFSNYSFRECVIQNRIITLDTFLIDTSGEGYTVERILEDSIILKDSENNTFDFPKEEIHNIRLCKMETKITAEEQIENSKSIIKAVLSLNIHRDMKKKVIDSMIWNITGANGKYKLPYISVSAKNNPNLKVNHEHVSRKKMLIDDILQNPENLETILKQALACIVTVEEHDRLNKIDKDNPELDGWKRYELAEIDVWDTINNKSFDY